MKKVAPFLVALVPYLFFAGLGSMLLFDLDSDVILLGFFTLYLLLGIISAVLYSSFASPQGNLWVKLAAIPTDGFAIGFLVVRAVENHQAAENGAMGVGLSIFVLMLLGFFYFLPRAAAMIACAVVCGKETKIKPIHKLLHLLPIADMVSAAIIRRNSQAL